MTTTSTYHDAETIEQEPNPYAPVILDSGDATIAAVIMPEHTDERQKSHDRYEWLTYDPAAPLPADTDPERVTWECFDTNNETRHLIDLARGPQTLREAAYDYATPWAFGYPNIVLGDGYWECPECFAARIEQSDPDERATAFRECVATAIEDPMQSGEYCECGAELSAPFCGNCGNEEDEELRRFIYLEEAGESAICSLCIGEAAQRGEAERIAAPYVPDPEHYRAYKVSPHRREWNPETRRYEPEATHAHAGTYSRYIGAQHSAQKGA